MNTIQPCTTGRKVAPVVALTGRKAFSIDEFCKLHGISRGMFYKLQASGKGPRIMNVGTRRLISDEAAADWRREHEATTAQEIS